jgi:hypothetical protein
MTPRCDQVVLGAAAERRFGVVGGGDLVVAIDQDHGRLPGGRLGGVDLGEGGDDDQVARAGQVGGRAVDADDAAVVGAAQRVGDQAGAAGQTWTCSWARILAASISSPEMVTLPS